jgi:hypothetical protein
MMYGRAGYELLKRHVLINLKELFLENNGIFIAPAHTFLPKVRKNQFYLTVTKGGSLIITSNKSFIEWGKIFGDEVLATAILDRLLHHAVTFNIKGDSYRLREKRKAGIQPAVINR